MIDMQTVGLLLCLAFWISFPFAVNDAVRNSSLFDRNESEDDKQ